MEGSQYSNMTLLFFQQLYRRRRSSRHKWNVIPTLSSATHTLGSASSYCYWFTWDKTDEQVLHSGPYFTGMVKRPEVVHGRCCIKRTYNPIYVDTFLLLPRDSSLSWSLPSDSQSSSKVFHTFITHSPWCDAFLVSHLASFNKRMLYDMRPQSRALSNLKWCCFLATCNMLQAYFALSAKVISHWTFSESG